MQQLPIFLNLAGERVLLAGTGDAADAKRRLIEAAGGVVVDELPARLAFVAIGDDAEAERIAGRLRASGLLVNVVDRPALCDFTVPAIVDRSPVVVAIGTGGTSATLAKALRERIEALLPASLGRLAERLFAARPALKARYPDAAGRRRALDALLAPGGALDPLGPASDIDAALASAEAAPSARAEVVVASPDPDDLTLRQLRLLSRADAIVAGPGVPAAILDRTRRDAARLSPGDAEPATGLVVALRWMPA